MGVDGDDDGGRSLNWWQHKQMTWAVAVGACDASKSIVKDDDLATRIEAGVMSKR
jgi:hypothetical protein